VTVSCETDVSHMPETTRVDFCSLSRGVRKLVTTRYLLKSEILSERIQPVEHAHFFCLILLSDLLEVDITASVAYHSG
jgi:hypothetical protein